MKKADRAEALEALSDGMLSVADDLGDLGSLMFNSILAITIASGDRGEFEKLIARVDALTEDLNAWGAQLQDEADELED